MHYIVHHLSQILISS